MKIDPALPLANDASVVVDPYPLADSVNFQARAGEVPLRVVEVWLGRQLNADVKLLHDRGDRFTAWVNGAQERDTVEIKVHARKTRSTGARSVMASRRKQQNLPGIEPGATPVEVTIPTMEWQQIGGDMDPSAHGGTIAMADGDHVELLKIQPVREYVGDGDAAEVGFPFWTKEAWFDLDDLDPKNDDVRSALQSAGFDDDGDQRIWFEDEATPEQRALVIAEALLNYGRGDEGPSGWSTDMPNHAVKWSNGRVSTIPEKLADEDEAFRDDVLGYGDIRTAIEETVERMADQNEAMAWSTPGDAMASDVEAEGFDPDTIVSIAEFGDAVAVNGDLTDDTIHTVEGNLERDGYELTRYGGRIPSSEAEVSAEHVVRAVSKELDRTEEDVEAAAKSLDWWQEEIPWSTSGDGSVWAKRAAAGVEESRQRRRVARSSGREANAGFAVGVYDQRLVEENAHERFNEDPEFKKKAIKEGLLEIRSGDITQAGWQQLNADIRQIESNALTWLHKKFVNARNEGHDDTDLVGTFWFDPTDPDQAYLVDLAADSGRQERIDMQDASFGDLSDTVWEGVSDFGASVLGGGITFFDVEPEDMEVVEQTLERERKRRK
jgi:hypothetical protein